MKILIASDFYPPFIGGAERQTQLLARSFVKRGHTVHVATTWHHGQNEYSVEEGVNVHRVKGLFTSVPWFSTNAGRRYHPPFPDPRMVAQIRTIVATSGIELVHSSGWIAYSCAAALIGTKIPFLISTRDYGYFCSINTLLHDSKICSGPSLTKCIKCAGSTYGFAKALASVPSVFLFKHLLLSQISGLHSISTYVLEQVRNYFLPGNSHVKHAIVPSFIESLNTNSLHDDKAESFLSSLPQQEFILFVGSLQAHKGIFVLLEAYKCLISPPPLVLIGTVWPDSPTEYPDNVIVLNNVPHDYVMLAWEHCLFGVAPSIWPEPLGAVIFEGMSKAKAMIGIKPSGHTDMIKDNETGFLIRAADSDALQTAMQKLIDNPELRKQFGEAGYRYATEFTAAKTIPQFESFYNLLVQSNPASSTQ